MSITTNSPSPAATATLSPVLSERFALNWQHALVCGWFAVFFMYLNYIPLFHTDIWCHVHYGKWILQHGALPQHDPFLPLAEGMRVVDTAWLSQVIMARVEAWGGAEFVSNLFAVVVLGNYLVQTRVFYLLSGRLSVAMAGMLLSWFIGWSRHAIVRPEIFGGLCFSLLLWMLVRVEPWRSRGRGFSSGAAPAERCPWSLWLGIPLLFLFWANMHGSFAVGLVALGCHVLGRVMEVAWQQRSVRAVLLDPWVRRWTVLTELALAATLINPYGLDLLIETARFGRNENLRDVLEWFPLKLVDLEGMQVAVSVILIIVLLRHSRQRMRPVDVLLLLVFAWAVAPTVRMIGWYAPILAFTMTPHLADIFRRLWPATPRSEPTDATSDAESGGAPQRFAYSLVCLLIVWCGFALSPISQPLLGAKPRDVSHLYSRDTPRGVTEYLRQHPPESMVFGPQWWGDWLVWDGPPRMQVFMTTSVHLAPRQVWRDYMLTVRGESGWERVLDRYGVDTLVIHPKLQPVLDRAARRSTQWQTVYEDDQGLVLRRKGATVAVSLRETEPSVAVSLRETEPLIQETQLHGSEPPTSHTSHPDSDPIPFSEAPSP